MTQAPYRPSIDKHGQPYFDELIYVNPKPELRTLVAKGVAQALNGQLPNPVAVAFNRVPLIWKNK